MADLLLVVDFDGTLYTGDAPVRDYTRRLARTLEPAAGAALVAAVDDYLADGPRAAAAHRADTVAAACLREARDGWGAALNLARRVHGTTAAEIDRAFAETREYIAEHDVELEPAADLIAALRALRGGVRLMLATNSPVTGMDVLLDRIGAARVFDDIVCSVGKPDGLRRLLARELGPNPEASAWRLFSVGDHYRNEIEPAVELGARAGYIDRFGRADGPAAAVAPTAAGVLPALHAWAADPRTPADGAAARTGTTLS